MLMPPFMHATCYYSKFSTHYIKWMLVPVELIPYEHEFFQCGGDEEHFLWDPWKADKALAEMEATEKVEQG